MPAWTDTSSAEVISSQSSKSGLAASALAIATRCRSPPLISLGSLKAVSVGNLTRSSNSVARFVCSAPRKPEELPQWAGDDGQHVVAGVERGVRVLRYELDAPPLFRVSVLGATAHRLTGEMDFSLVGDMEPSDATQQCGFTAPRLPDDAQRRAPEEAERHVGQSLVPEVAAAITRMEFVDLEKWWILRFVL